MTSKETRFIAHQCKLTVKHDRELRQLKNIVKSAKVKKKPYGCNSRLPTDTDWDSVYSDMYAGHRFYEDKQFKGHNGTFIKAICQL